MNDTNKKFENTVIAYKCKTCGRLGYYDMNKELIRFTESNFWKYLSKHYRTKLI